MVFGGLITRSILGFIVAVYNPGHTKENPQTSGVEICENDLQADRRNNPQFTNRHTILLGVLYIVFNFYTVFI